MKKWILKAVVQKGISFLPYKHRINFLFQKYITKGVRLSDDYFIDKLMHHRKHEYFYQRHSGKSLQGIKVLELGTGWYPVVPIAQYLSGAERIYTVDISPLMNRERVHTTVGQFLAYAKLGALSEYAPHILPTRLEHLAAIYQNPPATFEAYLEALHLE